MSNQPELPLEKTGAQAVVVYDEDKARAESRKKLLAFNRELNRNPPKKLIKRFTAGEQYDYLPIEYYENLLRQVFFGSYKIEIVHYGHIVNEITCHVRVHFKHPVTGEWLFVDGLGSSVIQQDAKTPIKDFIDFKKKNALQTMLPKAKSIAIKNALKPLGKIFGGHLNRKDDDEYNFFTGEVHQPLNQ